MKRIIIAMTAMLTMAVSASAMSYEQARREALFLTDKMAYELNLTDEQYDAAYEINLDYLMGVTSVDDVYGTYWTRRNLDFSYILLEWQWTAFQAATYFYRPLYWSAGCWHFGVYARYPRRDYFYFSRPTVYISYRGGHSWHHNGGRSYYYAHRDRFNHRSGHSGMRDRWDRGDYHHGAGNGKNSSTHVTVNRGDNKSGSSGFGGSRTSGSFGNNGNRTSSSRQGNTSRQQTGSSSTSTTKRAGSSFGGSRSTLTKRATGLSSGSKVTTNVRQQTTTARPQSVTRTNVTRPSSKTMTNRSAGNVRSVTSGASRSSGTSVSATPSGHSTKSSSRSSGGSSSKGSFSGRR